LDFSHFGNLSDFGFDYIMYCKIESESDLMVIGSTIRSSVQASLVALLLLRL